VVHPPRRTVQEANVDKWLNRFGQVAVIAIAVAAATVVLRPAVNQRSKRESGLEIGDRVDVSRLSLSVRTLLIATRSTCGYCVDSVPFYRTLSGVPIVWIAVGEDIGTNRQFLLGNGISPERLVTPAVAGLPETLPTPTIVVVDPGGMVMKTWVGSLEPGAQHEVYEVIGRSATPTRSHECARDVPCGMPLTEERFAIS